LPLAEELAMSYPPQLGVKQREQTVEGLTAATA
jgi:hypothetical protein